MRKDTALTVERVAGETGLAPADLVAFLAADNDSLGTAEALARRFGIALPEIEVYDFRAAGYLPEAITNFIALLGWSPGLKAEQGLVVEKFVLVFLSFW